MIEKWQEILALIVSVIGILTTIYKIGFKNKQAREEAYYEKVLRPFVFAYHENNDVDPIAFFKLVVKRSDDNVPKYVFFLSDNGEKDSLKKIFIYDYLELYKNDENTMDRIMNAISRFLSYIQQVLAIVLTFFAACYFAEGVLMLFTEVVSQFGKTLVGGASWKSVGINIVSGVIGMVMSIFCMKMAKWMNRDMYTFKKGKIDRIIKRKLKNYDKHIKKYVY